MISIVFPAYNEEGNVAELHRRIVEVMKKTRMEYEIIAVDNASVDGTYAALKRLSPITVVRMAYNIGQTAGLDAGMHVAKGDIIVTLDADLQNDPSDIPAMLTKLDDGYDLVAGWRKDRHDSFGRRLFSRFANTLARRILGVNINDYACALKVFRKRFLEGVHLYGEMHVFLAGILHFRGARITEMVVKHHGRTAGISKHTFIKGAKDVADLLTIRFLFGTTRPLVLFGAIGLLFFALAGLSFIAAVVFKLTGHHNFMQTPLPIMTAFFGIGGITISMMGLIAELVLRAYYETSGKTPYVVSAIERY